MEKWESGLFILIMMFWESCAFGHMGLQTEAQVTLNARIFTKASGRLAGEKVSWCCWSVKAKHWLGNFILWSKRGEGRQEKGRHSHLLLKRRS